MNPHEPPPRHVSLIELAELCGEDADALYWLSQQQPDSIDSAREFLRNWNQQIRPWLSKFKDEYWKGDQEAAFRVMAIAASFDGFPVPDWAAQALYRGWHAYTHWKPGAGSINAAMGINRQGKRQPDNRRRALFRNLAMWLIRDHAHLRNRTIDKELYDDVAKQLLDPSTIPQSYIRPEVEWTIEMFRKESGEPLTDLSGTTVGRWYEELMQQVAQGSAPTGRETKAETEKIIRHHLIFDNKKK